MVSPFDEQVNALSRVCVKVRSEHEKLEKHDKKAHPRPVDTCDCWVARAHGQVKELMAAAWEEAHRAKAPKLGEPQPPGDRE